MRDATTRLVERIWRERGERVLQEPRVDLGGAEGAVDQFRHLFKYSNWDIRQGDGIHRRVDVRNMWSSGEVHADSIGTFMSFDTLEHVYEFQEAVEQIGRVVFSGGVVLIGMPWMFGWHDPSGDYWRFSPQALERMFFKDFETIEAGFYDEDQGTFYLGRRRVAMREYRHYER